MLGIVIVSHGSLAQSFIEVVEHVGGKQQQMKAVGIAPEENPEAARERILQTIRDVNSGKGVVVLTDMFGGTPSNLAISVMKDEGVEVIAGVNVPMLIKLMSVRAKVPMDQAVNEAQEAARKYINVAGNLLAGK
jgi:mannose PTS system EIIA component